jgi:hypothetical protein
MARELVEIAASVRLLDERDHVDAYVVTVNGQPFCVASLLVFSTDTCSEAWREDFRALAKRIAEESFIAQGFRPHWISNPAAA